MFTLLQLDNLKRVSGRKTFLSAWNRILARRAARGQRLRVTGAPQEPEDTTPAGTGHGDRDRLRRCFGSAGFSSPLHVFLVFFFYYFHYSLPAPGSDSKKTRTPYKRSRVEHVKTRCGHRPRARVPIGRYRTFSVFPRRVLVRKTAVYHFVVVVDPLAEYRTKRVYACLIISTRPVRVESSVDIAELPFSVKKKKKKTAHR